MGASDKTFNQLGFNLDKSFKPFWIEFIDKIRFLFVLFYFCVCASFFFCVNLRIANDFFRPWPAFIGCLSINSIQSVLLLCTFDSFCLTDSQCYFLNLVLRFVSAFFGPFPLVALFLFVLLLFHVILLHDYYHFIFLNFNLSWLMFDYKGFLLSFLL